MLSEASLFGRIAFHREQGFSLPVYTPRVVSLLFRASSQDQNQVPTFSFKCKSSGIAEPVNHSNSNAPINFLHDFPLSLLGPSAPSPHLEWEQSGLGNWKRMQTSLSHTHVPQWAACQLPRDLSQPMLCHSAGLAPISHFLACQVVSFVSLLFFPPFPDTMSQGFLPQSQRQLQRPFWSHGSGNVITIQGIHLTLVSRLAEAHKYNLEGADVDRAPHLLYCMQHREFPFSFLWLLAYASFRWAWSNSQKVGEKPSKNIFKM